MRGSDPQVSNLGRAGFGSGECSDTKRFEGLDNVDLGPSNGPVSGT